MNYIIIIVLAILFSSIYEKMETDTARIIFVVIAATIAVSIFYLIRNNVVLQ